MFFNGSLFWFLMGILFVLIAAALKIFAEERGWTMTWWKWILALIWYAIFSLSFYSWGTLIGEDESSAGLKLLITGLIICVILGVGLWRLFSMKPKDA